MTVENLTLNVKANIGDSDKKIKSLAEALGTLQSKAAALTGLSGLSTIANAMASISGTSIKSSAFTGLAKGIENLSAALKNITSDDVSNLSALSSALRTLNNVDLGGLGNASNISKAASSLHDAARGIDDVAKSAKKAQSPVNNFISSLKRIAFYRFVRTIIKALTEAIKEGLENAYEWSKVMGTSLAPALDRIASATLQMKNQLGAAFGELIVAIEPMLVQLIHIITLLAEAFTWLFATLNEMYDGGSGYYMQAQEVATAWNEANKAAKEYKKTILGFDVINRLNKPDDNTTDYASMFNNAPTGFKDIDFEWKDITPFFAPLDDWTDATLEVLYELDALLNKIFSGTYELNLGFDWSVEPIPVLEKVKQWLDDLVAPSPYMVSVGVETMPSFGEVIDGIKATIAELLGSSPYIFTVKGEVVSPVPLLETIKNKIAEMMMGSPYVYVIEGEVVSPVPALEFIQGKIHEEIESIKQYFRDAYNSISNTLSEWATSFDNATNRVIERAGSIREGISSALSNTKGKIVTFTTESWNSIYEWGNKVTQTVTTSFETIVDKARTNLQTTRDNITKFASSTKQALVVWAVNSANSVQIAFVNIAENAYLGLQNAANNIVSFVNSTASSIAEWARTGIQNFAAWADGVVNTVASALSSAWESFKSFMNATGEKISTWWQANKDWAAPVAAGVAITAAVVGMVALAPPTGGASLAGLALLAANGGIFDEGQLFIAREAGPEMVGTIGGHSAVANNEQIVSAVSAGVYNAMMSAMSNGDSRNEIHVYLDSREIKNGQSRYARAMGV